VVALLVEQVSHILMQRKDKIPYSAQLLLLVAVAVVDMTVKLAPMVVLAAVAEFVNLQEQMLMAEVVTFLQ
jgi:hypothetical protein